MNLASSRSFFEEQTRRRRQTWFFLGLGAVWMGLMGFMVVAGHVEFVNTLGRELDRTFSGVDPVAGVRLAGWGAGVAVGVWALVALVLYLNSSRVIPKFVGARTADESDERVLAKVAEEVAIASGTFASAVRWYVLENPAQNAFACGRSPRSGSIVVTRGLLNSLEEDELRAVVAHELAHLKNGDTAYVVQALGFAWVLVATTLAVVWSAVIAALLVGLVAFLVFKVAEAMSEDSQELEGCIGSLVAIGMALGLVVMAAIFLAMYVLTLGVALLLVTMGVKWAASSISQTREYLADACAAQWTRNPGALASALTKIRDGTALAAGRARVVSPLLIHATAADRDESWGWKLFNFLFHSHPKMEDRIERLRSMAPLGGADWQLGKPQKGIVAALERLGVPVISLLATLTAVALVVGYVLLATSLPRAQAQAPNPALVQPAPSGVFGTVTETTVRLRAGPGTDRGIVTRLSKGTRVRILQSEGDWYKVEVEGRGQRGWVAKRLISVEEPGNSRPN